MVYLPKDERVAANVNNIYGLHKWDDNDQFDKWIDITEIGYKTAFDKDNALLDYLYVITDKCEEYANDEINGECLWDLYKEVKDKFENVSNDRRI